LQYKVLLIERQRNLGDESTELVRIYNDTMQVIETRQLKDLRGIGPKMLDDFERLGVSSVRQLKTRDAGRMYRRMCDLTGVRQDPCVLDTYRCAIEQARNPNLPEEQRDWWYWSGLRKAASRRA
jgi:hypothetical protein